MGHSTKAFSGTILFVACSVTRLGDLLDFGATFLSLWQQLICPNLLNS